MHESQHCACSILQGAHVYTLSSGATYVPPRVPPSVLPPRLQICSCWFVHVAPVPDKRCGSAVPLVAQGRAAVACCRAIAASPAAVTDPVTNIQFTSYMALRAPVWVRAPPPCSAARPSPPLLAPPTVCSSEFRCLIVVPVGCAALHSYGMPIRGPTTLYDEEGIITTVAAEIVSQTEFDRRTADGADTAQTQGVDEQGAAAVANANADGRVDPAIVKEYYESNGRKQSLDSKWSRFCRYEPERIEANLRAIGCPNVAAVQGNLPDLLQHVADHLDSLAAHYTVGIASKEDRQTDSAAMYASMDAVMVKVWKQLGEIRGGFMRLQVFDGKCLTVGVDVPTVAVVELDGADVERIKAKDQGFVDLVRNGPVECPIHQVSRPHAQRHHDLAPPPLP